MKGEKTKEKVLSQIILKYYKKPKKSLSDKPSGITCAFCLKKNVVNVGGGFLDKKGKPNQICEDCVVERYRREEGFCNIVAARARRRRIFDIGYLFNEMVIDEYLRIKGVENFKKLPDDVATELFIKSGDLFNRLFSKDEKVIIEDIENQKDIETELRKSINTFDFNQFFRNAGFL